VGRQAEDAEGHACVAARRYGGRKEKREGVGRPERGFKKRELEKKKAWTPSLIPRKSGTQVDFLKYSDLRRIGRKGGNRQAEAQ